MSTGGPPPNPVAAAGVNAGIPPGFLSRTGFSSVVRNATGDFTLTLTQPVDATGRAAVGCAVTVAGGSIVVVNEAAATDTTVNVLTTDEAGVAADLSFNVLVVRTT